MKKHIFIILFIILSFNNLSAKSINNTDYESSVTFPAGYAIGDYIEFLAVSPISAGASGYYQISITYTRGNVASAATHVASISHANPEIWRETGRINNNPYVGSGINFTIDCNSQFANPRFRIRAVNTLGINEPLTVYIKVSSLNFNQSYTTLNVAGNDLTTSKFIPMTSDWDLYVGNVANNEGANLAIKAIQNGNVGIGTATPDSKLAVNGRIHSQEVKVDMNGWSDFVFKKEYNLSTLEDVEKHIFEKGHLENIPSEVEVLKNGINLGEMNKKLLQKIEELTLYIIEIKKENAEMKKDIFTLKAKY